MKRWLLVLLLLGCGLNAAAQLDTTNRYAPLDSLLTQFYGALAYEENDVKCSEFDGLIASCTDSLMRQHVALAVFDHYRYSRIMGEEAVAVHIFEAERFALENRSTLIGMPAPVLTLRTPCGGKKTLPAGDRPSVLFFYSPGCSKCRLELYALPSVLAQVQFPMYFYAIDVDADRKEFKAFRKALKTSNRNVKMIHLWDPENESTLLLDYGVFSTPKVFVVWEGEILGRRLEMDSLQEIIQYINMLYGQEKEE